MDWPALSGHLSWHEGALVKLSLSYWPLPLEALRGRGRVTRGRACGRMRTGVCGRVRAGVFFPLPGKRPATCCRKSDMGGLTDGDRGITLQATSTTTNGD